MSRAEIVEKKQRFGTGDDQIVHAHRHEVDADRPVAAGLDGDAQLGADAVGRRDQDRIAVAGFGQVEQAAEAADPAHRAGPGGRFRHRRDPVDQLVAGRDIDSGFLVAFGSVGIRGDDGGFPGRNLSVGLGGLTDPVQSRVCNPVFAIPRSPFCFPRPLSMTPVPLSSRLFRPAALAATVILLTVALAAGPSRAEEKIYWVRDVPAKGKGKTDRAARRDAALNAAPAALDRLFRRLTSARDHEFLPPVPAERARSMVRGIEVVRAKRRKTASGRLFDGALSYLFRPGAVGALLRNEGIAWSARRSDPLLVLPIWHGEGGSVLWDDPNPWRDAWAATEREPGLVPVILPEGSLKDLQAIDAVQASERDAERLTAIAGAYRAKQVLVAVASIVASAGEEAGEDGDEESGGAGGLAVSAALFNLRSGDFEELEPVTAAGETAVPDAVAALAARLQERWKDRVIVPEGPVATTRVVLRFDDLAAWVRVRENLVAAPSVTGQRVIAFSAGEAVLALSHRGNTVDLAYRLPAFGLVLQHERGTGRKAKTIWVLAERLPEEKQTPEGEPDG